MALAFTACWTVSVLRAADDEKPKFTIKEIMKQAHKDKLLNKVLEGKATADEKATLSLLYLHLGKNKPPKGDEASWKKLTSALQTAAKEAEEGKPGAVDRLKAASKCGTCHSAHKK
jgi:hypothetical protein